MIVLSDKINHLIETTVKTTLNELKTEQTLQNQIINLKNRNIQLENNINLLKTENNNLKTTFGKIKRNNKLLRKDNELIKNENYRFKNELENLKHYRKRIPRNLRHNVFKRDNYRCVECGATNDFTMLTLDHIVPRSEGGEDNEDNLQTLCIKCNLEKGNASWKGGGAVKIEDKILGAIK